MQPTKENISIVTSGLEQFYAYMIQAKGFDLKTFVNFMEPRFKAAGYREASTEPGNILIMTETGVGDFVLSSGAIREIRRIYPAARITLLVRPNSFILAETCPYVDEVVVDNQTIVPSHPLEFYKINVQTAARLLTQRFDLCFALALHPKTYLLMYMSGARIRTSVINQDNWEAFNKSKGFAEALMRLATHLFPYGEHGVHMADRFFSILENMLHLPIANRKTEVWYTPVDIARAKNFLLNVSKPIYSLNMGGTSPNKFYPPEKYAKLLELILREEPTATFVILGGGQSDLKFAEILKSVAPKIYGEHIIDLTNKINYRESAAVLSLCDMHIGNDTGTMHVAAAVNCPVLCVNCFPADMPLWNTDVPRCFHPYGVPSVVVQAAHALPQCKNAKVHYQYGCAMPMPHCIAQIEPTTLLKGFHLLKERAAAQINEPLYIH